MVTINNTGAFKGVQTYGNLKGEALDPEIEIIGTIDFRQGVVPVPPPSTTAALGRKCRIYGYYHSMRVVAGDTTEYYGLTIYKENVTYMTIVFRVVPGTAAAKEGYVSFPFPIDLEATDTWVLTGNAAPTAYTGYAFIQYVD